MKRKSSKHRSKKENDAVPDNNESDDGAQRIVIKRRNLIGHDSPNAGNFVNPADTPDQEPATTSDKTDSKKPKVDPINVINAALSANNNLKPAQGLKVEPAKIQDIKIGSANPPKLVSIPVSTTTPEDNSKKLAEKPFNTTQNNGSKVSDPKDEKIEDKPPQKAEVQSPANSGFGDEGGEEKQTELSEEEQKKAAEDEKRENELQSIVDSKKYFVPINAVARNKSIRVSALLTFIILLLSIVLVDLMLDSGLILLVQKIPHTHFFSTNQSLNQTLVHSKSKSNK